MLTRHVRYFSGNRKSKSIPLRHNEKFNRYVDMQLPHLWYPQAREIAPRKIVCHVGPTNSGYDVNVNNLAPSKISLL